MGGGRGGRREGWEEGVREVCRVFTVSTRPKTLGDNK